GLSRRSRHRPPRARRPLRHPAALHGIPENARDRAHAHRPDRAYGRVHAGGPRSRADQGPDAAGGGDQRGLSHAALAADPGAARERFDAAIARLWLMDDDGDTLSVRVSAGLEVGGGVDRLRVGEGFVGRVAATRAPLTIADLASDPRPLNTERLRARGLAAFAGVPLLVGERVLGVLAIGLTERHEYSAEELDVFTSLANGAAVALE